MTHETIPARLRELLDEYLAQAKLRPADNSYASGERRAYLNVAEDLRILIGEVAVDALSEPRPPAPERERAVDYAWPQDAEGLVEMAREWGGVDGDDLFAEDVLIHKLGTALEAALAGSVAPPAWWQKCRATGHDVCVNDLAHRGGLYVGVSEYFCSECSRGETGPMKSVHQIYTRVAVRDLEDAAHAIEMLCGQLEAASGRPVLNNDYAYRACGGSTPAQDIANLRRYAEAGRVATANREGAGSVASSPPTNSPSTNTSRASDHVPGVGHGDLRDTDREGSER